MITTVQLTYKNGKIRAKGKIRLREPGQAIMHLYLQRWTENGWQIVAAKTAANGPLILHPAETGERYRAVTETWMYSTQGKLLERICGQSEEVVCEENQ